ncbi:MAG: tetratricopeptide repeat protein [Brevinema sp.]
MRATLFTLVMLASPLFSQEDIRRGLEQRLAQIRSLTNATVQQITEAGDAAIATYGERFDIHTAIGDAYFAVRDSRRAVNSFRRAQSLNPRSATGYNRLGLALLRIGNYRQAEVSFKAAASYTGNINARAGYLASLGQALENSKDNQRALQAFEDALKANPNNIAAQEGRGRLLIALSNQ